MADHTYRPVYWDSDVRQSAFPAASATLQAAAKLLPKPASILDLGCGAGSWLKMAGEVWPGVEVVGLDHPATPRDKLLIESFQPHDLTQSVDLGRRFDLALSVEVAEHLPEEAADRFVESLCRHADTVLFSAAIPFQYGSHHVNCRWPAYWAEKFARHGLTANDVLRPMIWEDAAINWWYRQNIMIYARDLDTGGAEDWRARAIVHPESYAFYADPERIPGRYAWERMSAVVRRKLAGRRRAGT